MSSLKGAPKVKQWVLPILCTVTVLLPSLVLALTMDEAVGLALRNNHRIKEYRNLAEAQSSRVRSKRSAFLPEVDLTYSFTQTDKDLPYQTRRSSMLSLELNLNLFNGFMDLRGLEAERHRLRAAVYQQRAVEADVVLDVKKAYIEVLRAEAMLDVAKEAVTLLQSQRDEVALRYREGLVARNELLKVEVELASAEQGLSRAESALSISRKALERLIGVGIGEEELEGLDEEALLPYEEERLEEMLKQRSELEYLRALKRSMEYDRDAIRSGYLPSVDLTVSHELYGDSAVPDGRTGLHDTETRAVVKATWNLFDGLRKRHEALAEEAGIRAVEERIKDTEEELGLQLRTALDNYHLAAGRLEVAEKAVEQAEENYRITENQFRQRMATATDLLDARFYLTRARNDLNNAIYDMHSEVAVIERIVEAGPGPENP